MGPEPEPIPATAESKSFPFSHYATFSFVGFAAFFVGAVLEHFTRIGDLVPSLRLPVVIPFDILAGLLLYFCALLGLYFERRLTWPAAFTGLLLAAAAFFVSWSVWLLAGPD